MSFWTQDVAAWVWALATIAIAHVGMKIPSIVDRRVAKVAQEREREALDREALMQKRMGRPNPQAQARETVRMVEQIRQRDRVAGANFGKPGYPGGRQARALQQPLDQLEVTPYPGFAAGGIIRGHAVGKGITTGYIHHGAITSGTFGGGTTHLPFADGVQAFEGQDVSHLKDADLCTLNGHLLHAGGTVCLRCHQEVS